MTHVVAVSNKLRDRAVRIVMDLGGLEAPDATALVEECEGSPAAALDLLARRSEES